MNTMSRYWVEFIDYNGIQKSIYLYGESVEQLKMVMNEYEIVVIDNTETSEEAYWGFQPISRVEKIKL